MTEKQVNAEIDRRNAAIRRARRGAAAREAARLSRVRRGVAKSKSAPKS